MTFAKACTLLDLSPKHGMDKQEIKRGYRKKAQKVHPDKGGEAEQFIEIRQAYQFLLDALINEDLYHFNEEKSGFEQQKNEDIFYTKTAPKKTKIETPNFYKTTDSLKDYFEDRIQDLETKLQAEKQRRCQDREKILHYEQTLYKHIRLMDLAKKNLHIITENWKNNQQYAEDYWTEEVEKTEILHNLGKLNTMQFLAKKDSLDVKKESILAAAANTFQDEVLGLVNHTISTFYSLLDG